MVPPHSLSFPCHHDRLCLHASIYKMVDVVTLTRLQTR